MTAVDQDGQLDAARPPDVVQRGQRSTYGPAGEEHVVDEHHGPAVDTTSRDVRRQQCACRPEAQVVAVHRDVQAADQDLAALDLGHPFRQPRRELDTARRDAEQDEVMGAVIALEHLVGDPSECTVDV